MKDPKLLTLTPHSTYRTPLRSDTFWGMICWGIRAVHGNDVLEEFLTRTKVGKPDFVLSSTFPWLEFEGIRTHFFPRPILPPDPHKFDKLSTEEKEKRGKKRKKIKEIKLVAEDTFFQILQGELSGTAIDDALEESSERQPKEENSAVTHNTLNRHTWSTATQGKEESGQLFHSEESAVVYPLSAEEEEKIKDGKMAPPQTGLFCLVQGEDFSLLESALRYLEHTGLGADRATGKGFFSFELSELPTALAAGIDNSKANAWMNLSLLYPTEAEVEKLEGNPSPLFTYALERRQGKVGMVAYDKNKEKEPLIMFKEGSLFPKTVFEKEIAGCMAEVLPQNGDTRMEHPVYQNGLSLLLPVFVPYAESLNS